MTVLCTVQAVAQPVQATLLGEGNEKSVKLLWLPGNWPKGLQGFMIKRRTVTGAEKGDWELVTQKPVLPGLSTSKDLSNVESSEKEQQRLQKKLSGLIAAGRAKEIPNADYLKKLVSDSNAIRAFPLVFALDYDLAILNGFGLVDRDVPRADAYEYGLFPVINNKIPNSPLSTFQWQYGTKPNINLPLDIKLTPNHAKDRIGLEWTFSSVSFKTQKLNGFNIYRKEKNSYTKLNENILWVNLRDKTAKGSFTDSTAKPNVVYTYAIVPSTLFGTEGSYTESVYDPSKIVFDIPAPVLHYDMAASNKDKAVSFSWDFDVKMEPQLKGFMMERFDNKQKAYVEISSLLPPATRTFADSKNLPASYYRYRIVAVRQTDEKVYSNEELVYFNPVTEPPVPKGLTAKWIKEGERYFVILKWDPKDVKDTLTYGYRLYSSFPPDTKLSWEVNIPTIRSTTYKYEVFNPKSARYYFAISAITRSKEESDLSKTAEVVVPTTHMPVVVIKNVSLDSNKVNLSWRYEDLADLKGFRIYMNGTLIADADKISAQKRQWVSEPLKPGGTYTFEVQGISSYGITSNKSFPVTLTLQKPMQR